MPSFSLSLPFSSRFLQNSNRFSNSRAEAEMRKLNIFEGELMSFVSCHNATSTLNGSLRSLIEITPQASLTVRLLVMYEGMYIYLDNSYIIDK